MKTLSLHQPSLNYIHEEFLRPYFVKNVWKVSFVQKSIARVRPI